MEHSITNNGYVAETYACSMSDQSIEYGWCIGDAECPPSEGCDTLFNIPVGNIGLGKLHHPDDIDGITQAGWKRTEQEIRDLLADLADGRLTIQKDILVIGGLVNGDLFCVEYDGEVWRSVMPSVIADMAGSHHSVEGALNHLRDVKARLESDPKTVFAEANTPSQEIYYLLSDTPVDEEDGEYLDIDFFQFPKGAPVVDIWHWLEERDPSFILGKALPTRPY